jgi:O-antigen/teichoic acid export membrane protein
MANAALQGTESEQTLLDRVLVNGMAWTAAWRWTGQAVSWIGTAVAARILTPGDYGLVGMAMLGIGLVRMVEDFGLDAVLIQDRTIDGTRQARLAGLVILAGVVLSLAFALLSGPIAGFFKEPKVAALVMVLGLLFINDAVQVVPRAMLQREMEFRKLALMQFLQVVVTQSILVCGAMLGWGVWALVFNTLGGALATTLLLVYWRPFAVHWPRGLAELSRPLTQGWRILAARFTWYIYTSADQTVIGRVLGKDALGTYSFAMTFSTTITQEVTMVIGRVVPGVFSSVQTRPEELRRYFLLLTELLCYLAFPVAFGVAVTSDLVVGIVLGPQWEGVVAPLRILCIYAAFYAAQALLGHLLLWTGRFRANMWCNVLAAVVLPVAFYVGARWGLEGIAWAWVIAFPLANLPNFVIAFRIIAINTWAWLGALMPSLFACSVMTVAVMLVRQLLRESTALPVEMVASVVTGVLTYVGTLFLLNRARLRRMAEFLRLIGGGSAIVS